MFYRPDYLPNQRSLPRTYHIADGAEYTTAVYHLPPDLSDLFTKSDGEVCQFEFSYRAAGDYRTDCRVFQHDAPEELILIKLSVCLLKYGQDEDFRYRHYTLLRF